MFLLIPIAFLSGVLTVFSPCVLPILPIILSSGIDGKISRIRGVIAGLVISFTVASLLLSIIVRLFGIPAETIRNFAVGFLVLFALTMVFPRLWEKIQVFIEQHWKITPARNQSSGFGGGFLTGISLGIVWTPCIGPIVATVATLAAINSFSPITVFIAFAYALGTGVPLYFIAKGGQAVTSKLTIFKTNNQGIRQVFGVIILGTALFIGFGYDRLLQAWTLSHLPPSWTQLAKTFEEKANVNQSLEALKKKDSIKKATSGSTVVKKVSLQNDFTGAKVKPNELVQGCFSQDCIPSIDNPKFEDGQKASWLQENDIVFTLNYQGIQRAYPQRILNWHEIVNDEIASNPIAITFCPLCGSAVAFERKVDGVITQFGVSGKLHNSDLVMYDRYEGNLWQQITGEAIVGPAAQRNEKLKPVLLATTTWRAWRTEFPNTQVLSRDTGFSRNYEQYPYGTYEKDNQLLFGVKDLNKSLQIKTVVYGVEVNGKSKAYPASAFDTNAILQDSLGETKLKLEKTASGEIEVTNLQTNDKIIPLRLFWFAWAAFHPDTKLYSSN